MKFELSAHVKKEIERRGIPLDIMETVLAKPDQKVTEHGSVMCFQSKIEINKKLYLLRVMVNETVTPFKVITAYRTSKINKYWSATT